MKVFEERIPNDVDSEKSFRSDQLNEDGSIRMKYCMETFFITFMFMSSYGFSTISVKMCNEVYGFQAPWFTSFMCALGFIFNGCVMVYTAKPGEIKWKTWVSPIYVAASTFASGNVIFTSISLNYLPGSVVMVLKASSVIMTVIEYSVFRGKKYSVYHWLGIFCICLGVVLIGLFSQSGNTVFSWNGLTMWGFAAAFIASLTQALKKTTIKTISKSHTHSFTGMAEGAFCNLLLCAFLSIFFGLVTDEIWLWPTYINIILQTSGYLWGGLFILAMGSARGFAFLFQWLIVRNTSATFSQVMTNARRLFVIIFLIIVLKEPTNFYTWWAVGLMIIGMNLYVIGSYVQEKYQKAAQAKKNDLKIVNESTPLLTENALAVHDEFMTTSSSSSEGSWI